ncbi:MAG: FAD-dependent oxidoreductase [Pseudomonadota bacterium]
MGARIVILGAGQAGAALAAKLRSEGHDGAITLIGEEATPPYQRPPLSKKYLLGETPKERLFLKPEAWYAENDVDLRIGVRAEAVDLESRQVVLAGGEAVPFDLLAFCTGARPRWLPEAMGGALPGVFAMRDLADADALGGELREGARALVIGGGYIGLEAAAVLASRGAEAVLVEAADRILGRVASGETATWFADLHRGKGVTVIEGAALERLEAGEDGHLAAARLGDGRRIEADFAVVGIGVIPNGDLAEAAGIETVRGAIRVDARARTSADGVFAAGDCTILPWRGREIRLESVQNAIDQAEAAAMEMLGKGEDYDPVPWFWSDQYDVKLQIAGLGAEWDRVVERPGAREGAVSHWYFRDGELIAVDAMNDPRAYMTGKRWLEAGKSPDADALADPQTDLKTL